MKHLETIWKAMEAELPGSMIYLEPHLGKMDGESKREELDDLMTELTEELAMPELKD